MEERATTEPDYEHGEPRTGLIALFGLGTVAGLVALVLGIQFYFDRVEEQQVYVKQMAPLSDDLLNLRAREDTELHSYQYLDRAAGKVRVPIERGMELLAREAAEGKLKYPAMPTPVAAPAQGAPTTTPQPGGTNAPPAPAPAR